MKIQEFLLILSIGVIFLLVGVDRRLCRCAVTVTVAHETFLDLTVVRNYSSNLEKFVTKNKILKKRQTASRNVEK